MRMKLIDLMEFEDVVIQCHDNPDADSIASGYALYEFFKQKQKKVQLIYGGRFAISKPNLVELIKGLEIPIVYTTDFSAQELLITVDCQYGAGNIQKFDAPYPAMIDHHQQEVYDIERTEIRSFLGSCSTLIWQMLQEAGFDANEYLGVATALYYGLFSDTNSLAEINHPLDKDMRDNLVFDAMLIRKLKNTNLSLKDIETAGIALLRCSHNDSDHFAVFKSQPCDPNILGFISDIALQVNSINTCVVYNQTSDGIKFSVRSCIREVMASEMAAFLAEGIGSGGGHLEKAGGFISFAKLIRNYGNVNADAYLLNRIRQYYDYYDLIYCGRHNLDISTMKLYQKNPISVGFVPSTALFPVGTPLLIRTLEGDVETNAADDIYFMAGIRGEVYPIKKEKFDRSYRQVTEPFVMDSTYIPSVKNRLTGEAVALIPYLNSCQSTGEVVIYADVLKKNTKIFTSWDLTRYMSGKVGDFVAIRQDDNQDVYIIEESIFAKTYTQVPE